MSSFVLLAEWTTVFMCADLWVESGILCSLEITYSILDARSCVHPLFLPRSFRMHSRRGLCSSALEPRVFLCVHVWKPCGNKGGRQLHCWRHYSLTMLSIPGSSPFSFVWASIVSQFVDVGSNEFFFKCLRPLMWSTYLREDPRGSFRRFQA